MKKFIFKLGLFAFISVAFIACQNDDLDATTEAQEVQNVIIPDASKQFVGVKDVSNDPTMPQLVEKLVRQNNKATAKRVGCTLDSDIGCGSDAAEEIEEYVNLSNCISFSKGTLIIPIESREFTYNYSYYIDGDGDINMDQYQYQFDSHVADIAQQIAPKKIALVSADASNACGRRWKVSSIKYTVILGN
ncbi:hypothetical protein ATE84_3518 [Aquimarina sp. MAR_2010_214]|uniref:hypothetical protein n=1 Tax=Aquimarina sp. MAR_2010_214 TaxID=1250026 RepID=UPI000C70C5DB|nr:hypothetical protein [Aquimarina sp. MAR_2010_214]PKV51433.1 hypothetical protein ATE84_3518 [Aquimarina sp. MAR_2010_214]